ncbi:MAG TPA: hypothetical protein VLM76_08935 [Patescibacteria group bacterium]|nr:hypothetical protein [Patescibacteria group bacterium]
MGPTPRDWLGAGLLALVLVAMIVVLVIVALPHGDETGASLGVLLLGA